MHWAYRVLRCTDAECLELQAEPKVELEEIVEQLERKISPDTPFNLGQ